MRVNIANQFQQPTTSALVTPITAASTLLPLIVSRPAATTHPEDTLNPLGLFVQWSAITGAGTNSYQFQVQQSSDNAGLTNALVVADTGVMVATGTASTTTPTLNNTSLFLRIDWNTISQPYLGCVVKLAGNGTPSISILMAGLMNLNDVPSGLGTVVAANYTP
jgi:hypothetical protein